MDNFNNPNVNPDPTSSVNSTPTPPQQNPNPYQQPNYTPYNPYTSPSNLEEPLSVGQWMLTMLVCALPCVNLIMLLVWAFQSTGNKSRSNWAKANLIWAAIGFAIYFILIFILLSVGFTTENIIDFIQ